MAPSHGADRPPGPGIVRIATRGSALALAQAEIVADLLRAHHPGVTVELVIVRTAGDLNQQAPVTQLGDGAFVRGVEAALLNDEADIAVHSAKDVPSTETPGLTLAAFPERADPSDALVSRRGEAFDRLPRGARLGTSSPRRSAISRSLRADIEVLPIRGNVDTRLRRLREGDYDAIVLASAGLARLGLADEATERLDPRVWIPAAGQGALAVQCRAGDAVDLLLAPLDHRPTRAAVLAERAVLRRLGSGCRMPVGVHAEVEDGELTIHAVLVSPDMSVVRESSAGVPSDAEQLGTDLAERLMRQSASPGAVEGR